MLNPNYGRLRERALFGMTRGETEPSILTQRVLYTYFNDQFSGVEYAPISAPTVI